MNEEIQSIEKNNTWKITNLLIGKKPIGVKWVYKTKYKLDGKVYRFKVRLIAKGCKQKLGIDYFEIFFTNCQTTYHLHDNCICSAENVKNSPNGYEVRFS